MAEFLVKAVDAIHPDPAKDARGCFKTGDVVVAAPDGHQWGAAERLPRFVVIKIPGLALEDVRQFAEPAEDARRKWRFIRENAPPEIMQQLREKGEVSVSWEEAKIYLQNKLTGDFAELPGQQGL